MKSDYYLNFENKFRGSRENIIKRLSIYDSLIDLFISENNEYPRDFPLIGTLEH